MMTQVYILQPLPAAHMQTQTVSMAQCHCVYACRVDLLHQQLYVLLSNGHIHVWRMHSQKAPTLAAVWDKLTPNQRDRARCMTFMRGMALDPALAEMQGIPFAASLPGVGRALLLKLTPAELRPTLFTPEASSCRMHSFKSFSLA